jgi:hypothetical protein
VSGGEGATTFDLYEEGLGMVLMEELVGEFKIFFSYLRDISHNWRKQQS